MKFNSKILLYFSLFMVLLCCFSAVSASENITDDISLASDDIAVDEVATAVDSVDESIAVENTENLESVDDSINESVAVQDDKEVNTAVEEDSSLANEKENDVSGQTHNYAEGAGGNPHIKIYNNRFVDHAATGIDTVVITGNDYLFRNNVFINSYQNTQYTGTGNTYNTIGTIMVAPSKKTTKSILGATNDGLLSDYDEHSIIYVNGSSNNDYTEDDINGQSWDKAWGSPDALPRANNYILDNGIIYVAEGEYIFEDYETFEIDSRNITVIGQGKNTIIKQKTVTSYLVNTNKKDSFVTFINLTFCGASLNTNANFINCTFIDSSIIINDGLLKYQNSISARDFEEYGNAWTRNITLDNCVFKDISAESALITLNQFGAVNFNKCAFENIIADSLVYRISGYFQDDEIVFKNCNFTGSKFNGVVDSAANFDDAITIEDCIYDGEVALGTSEIDGHFYVNTTKLTTPSKDNTTNTTPVVTKSNVTINAPKVSATYNVAKNLLITVKDANGTILANKKVTVKVGTISKTLTTNAKGQVSVNVATLVPKKYTATITFAGDNDYNALSTKANVVVAKATPKLTTKKLTTKVKVKTKKVTATLKNNKGKVLKNVKVTLKIKGKTYTAKTNKKGVATFKVTKLNKKGTFKGTVKFAGNKYFKAISKKVTVVVKK